MGWTSDAFLGISSYAWRVKHNVAHHTYTNVDGYDDDINQAPFARLTPNQAPRRWYRLQHIYIWPLYSLMVLRWQTGADVAALVRGRIARAPSRPAALGLRRPGRRQADLHRLGDRRAAVRLPVVGRRAGYLTFVGVASLITATTFQLAHCVEEADFASVDQVIASKRAWAVHEVETTVDFCTGNVALTWVLGGLNYQIEHHLFPQLPHTLYPRIAAIVRRNAAKHGVRYTAQPSLYAHSARTSAISAASAGWACRSRSRWADARLRRVPRSQRRRRVTEPLLFSAIALIALGTVVAAGPSGLRHGLVLQSCGAAVLGVLGFWVLGAGDALGSAFSSSFEPRFGVDPLSGFFLATLGVVGAPALLYASRYLVPGGKGRALGALDGRISPRARRGALRPRSAHLPCGLGAHDDPAGRHDPGRHSDRRARRTVFVYVAFTHLAGAGTWVAVLLARARRSARRSVHDHGGLGAASVDRAGRPGGDGDEGRRHAAAQRLPRAHPIAPAPISALMSGVMIKVAVYGLIRVLVDWLGVVPIWLGVLVLAIGALSAVAGVVYALFQHELKRLLAFHSIENIGIIVLGLGACLCSAPVERTRGRRSRSPPPSCTPSTMRSSRPCSSSARGRSSAPSGGSTSTGSVGCCDECRGPAGRSSSARWRSPDAAAQRLRLGVADVPGPAPRVEIRRCRRRLGGRTRARSPGRDRRPGRPLLREGRRPRAARAGAAPHRRVCDRGAGGDAGSRGASPAAASYSASLPACSSAHSPASRRGPRPRRRRSGSTSRYRRVAHARARDRSLRSQRLLALLRGRRVLRPRRPGCAASSSSRNSPGRAPGSPSPCGSCSSVLRPEREIAVDTRGGVMQSVSYSGRVPQLVDERVYRPCFVARLRRGAGPPASDRAPRHVRRGT